MIIIDIYNVMRFHIIIQNKSCFEFPLLFIMNILSDNRSLKIYVNNSIAWFKYVLLIYVIVLG